MSTNDLSGHKFCNENSPMKYLLQRFNLSLSLTRLRSMLNLVLDGILDEVSRGKTAVC